MRLFEAVVLGVVEGLTEFLPVSSTGHLIVVGHFLNAQQTPQARAFADAFDVVVQAGALGAVLVHYRALLAARVRGLVRGDPRARALFSALLVASVPALLLGFLFRKAIERHLFGPVPVAIALIVGGALMVVIERALRGKGGPDEASAGAEQGAGLVKVDLRRALVVGVAQCAALWPGTSRSMSTLVGARLAGLDTKTAAEFSFLLALPTLGAATLYKLVKSRAVLFAGDGAMVLSVGTVTAFLVAWAVVAGFLSVVRRWGLAPFGYYRIALGLSVLAMMKHLASV